MKKLLLSFLILALIVPAGQAQTALPEIEIIFDSSGSMLDPTSDGIPKIDAAKQSMKTIIQSIEPNSKVGLRVFGANPTDGDPDRSCKDSELVIPIAGINKQQMSNLVSSLTPLGQTPIGYSLQEGANDFTADPNIKKTIILISDGEESCGLDPISVVQALRAKGIELVVHVIGFGVNPQAEAQLQQIAEMTGGIYASAGNASELTQQLERVAVKAELLLVPEKKSEGENILAAANGCRIVSSSKEELAQVIDGDEGGKGLSVQKGEEVVFAFKENQPVLIESFGYPISAPNVYHPKYFDLYGSANNPETFQYIGRVNLENKVFFENIYQFSPVNVAVRYLKVVVGPRMSDHPTSMHTEWFARGRYLTEEEFQAQLDKAAKQERNLLATENGGNLVASSQPELQFLIDGNAASPGKSAYVKKGAEGVFGFNGGKIAVIKKITTPIMRTLPTNVKTIEIWATTQSPASGYEKVGTFQTVNLAFTEDPYQEYVFEKPVRAKFIKVKLIDSHENKTNFYIHELRAIGTLE